MALAARPRMAPVLCLLLLRLAGTVAEAAPNGFAMQGWTGAWGSDGPINVGDLNGDGRTDVFMWRGADNSWTVNLSTGTGFTMQRWTGAWGSDGPINVGDLNGDGRTDVFMWRGADNSWTVNLSTGTGFTMQRWTGAWGSDGPINVGDLNGDGRTDVFMWRGADNSWTVNLSTGAGFAMQRWTGAWGSDGPINVGDLNGDGRTDVFMWREADNSWTVNLSTGTGFVMQRWTGAWGSDGPINVGDLNGDGRTDVFMWRAAGGDWTVNLSNGNGWSMQRWLGACGSEGPLVLGDLNGDHRTDVAIWKDASKDWMANLSTGSGFNIQRWTGAWGSDGPRFAGDLNGDGRVDVFMWRDPGKDWTVNVSVPTTLGSPRTAELAVDKIWLAALPNTGDVSPDVLVRAQSQVQLFAISLDSEVCLVPQTVTWTLEYIPRGGLKQDVTAGVLKPPQASATPQFIAARGTFRASLRFNREPSRVNTITIEAAEPDEWVHIGPDGRLLDGSGWGGRVNAAGFDPNVPGRMYAATPNGGVFRSDDAGRYWYPLSDRKVVGAGKIWKSGLHTQRVVVLPNSHVVVATGDAELMASGFGHDSPPFYLSSDGGLTWHQGGVGCTDPAEPDAPSGPVFELIVHPRTGSLFAAAGGSIYRSNSEGNCWRRIDPPSPLRGGKPLLEVALQLVGAQGASRTYLYAAANVMGDKTTVRRLADVVFVTTDAMAATPVWSKAVAGQNATGTLNTAGTTTVERIQLVASKDMAYALVPIGSGAGLQLFRAAAPVAGQRPTWTMATSPPTVCNGQCDYYDIALAVNPGARPGITPGNEVVVAGVANVVRSTDGGANWVAIGNYHDDHHWLQFDPFDPARLWDASDGGLSVSSVPSGSWESANSGLHTVMAYTASVSGSDPQHAITGIGLQDNGNYIRKSRGRIWDRVSGCDGFQAQFDAVDAKISYEGPLNCGRAFYRLDLPNNQENLLGSVQFFRADPYHQGRVIGINPSGNANLYQAYVVDGVHQGLGPVAWKCIDPQPTLTGQFISAVLFSPADSNRYLMGNLAGDVYRSDYTKMVGNAGCGNTDTAGDAIYTTQPAPKGQVADLALDPADSASFYATHQRSGQWRVVHLRRDLQADRWTPEAIGSNFPDLDFGTLHPAMQFINPIGADPRRPEDLFVGTEAGLFLGHPTVGTAWTPVPSFPNTWTVSLMTAAGLQCDVRGVLRAATHGRSVWERMFPTGTVRPLCVRQAWRIRAFFPRAELGARAATEALLQVSLEGEGGRMRPPGKARITLLRRREPTGPFAVEPAGTTDEARLFIVRFLGESLSSVLETDQVRVETLAADDSVEASDTFDATLLWRAAEARTLQIAASLSRGGGAAPVVGLEVRVGDRVVTTPATLALPRGTAIRITAPAAIPAGKDPRAAFAGWDGFARPSAGWDDQKPIPGERKDPELRIVLEDDVRVELKYATERPEEDRPKLSNPDL